MPWTSYLSFFWWFSESLLVYQPIGTLALRHNLLIFLFIIIFSQIKDKFHDSLVAKRRRIFLHYILYSPLVCDMFDASWVPNNYHFDFCEKRFNDFGVLASNPKSFAGNLNEIRSSPTFGETFVVVNIRSVKRLMVSRIFFLSLQTLTALEMEFYTRKEISIKVVVPGDCLWPNRHRIVNFFANDLRQL